MGKKVKLVLKPGEEWIFVEVPAIVSKELWNECNPAPKAKQQWGKMAKHLFAGLTFCHCGGKMYVKRGKYLCLTCWNKIPAEDLEAIFDEQLKEYLSSKDEIGIHVSDIEKNIQNRKQTQQSLTKDIEKLTSSMNALFDLHEKGEIPTDGFKHRYEPLYEQLKQKESYHIQLQGEIDAMQMHCASTSSVFTEAQVLHSGWNEKSPTERRLIVEDITDRIVIAKEDIEIVLKGIPLTPSSDLMSKWLHHPTV